MQETRAARSCRGTQIALSPNRGHCISEKERTQDYNNISFFELDEWEEGAFAMLDRTRNGDFSPQGLRGFDLRGRTIGIVGTGDIGRHVARIATGFDLPVIAFDVEPGYEAAKSLEADPGHHAGEYRRVPSRGTDQRR